MTADKNKGYLLAVPGSEEVIVGKNSNYENMGSPESLRDIGIEACKHDGVFVLDCLPSDDYSHVVGGLLFGVDNALYVTHGDGATTYGEAQIMVMRALNLDSMAGKILRVDRDTGQGLPDNPFYDGNPDSNRSKVINYGLRNPFGLAFMPDSEELVMGDVGWHDWEELNIGYGQNYGWPCYEGENQKNRPNPKYTDLCREYLNTSPDITPAIYAYEHDTVSGSITGVGVYTDHIYPPKYHNAIFFTDIVRSNIVTVLYEDGEFLKVEDFASNVQLISRIRRGANGNLFFLSLDGSLKELIYQQELSEVPVPILTADKTSGDLPLSVSFSASDSTDPNGRALSYKWDFGDDSQSQEVSPQHTYNVEGNYTVNLIVKNEDGDFAHASIMIHAGNTPPSVFIDEPSGSLHYQPGDTVNYLASASDAQDALHDLTFSWTATASSGEHHFQALSSSTAINGSFIYPDIVKDSYVELCVEVTDQGQLSTKSCKRLIADEKKATKGGSGSGILTPYELLVIGFLLFGMIRMRLIRATQKIRSS